MESGLGLKSGVEGGLGLRGLSLGSELDDVRANPSGMLSRELPADDPESSTSDRIHHNN